MNVQRALLGLGLLAGASCAPPAPSPPVMPAAQPPPTVRVGVDERAELLAIIWRLAGSAPFGQGRLQPYIGDIDRHFGPHKDHPAVNAARELRAAGIDFGAVMAIAVHLSDPYEMRVKVPFDTAGGVLDLFRADSAMRAKFMGGVRRFLPEARRFAEDSRAREFFAAHRPLYDTATARMRRMVERHAQLAWFDRFVGRRTGNDFVVVPLLATNESNFGAPLPGIGVRPEVYAFLSVRNTGMDPAGFPVYDKEMMGTLVHEFGHSYFNPLVAANFGALQRSGPAILAAVADAMRDQAYGDWRAMMFESLVRAGRVRYVLAHEGAEAARRALAEEYRESFLWTGELADVLGEYEADRARYPTLDLFMPRVVTYFDSLPRRVEELKRRYDVTRPKVASLSIENGSESVDPALTEIVVRFDRPVRMGWGSVTPVRGGRDRFPKITRQELDTTGTTFRLGVALEPGREYELRLGVPSGHGFVTPDNVPLAPYHIRFRTRAQRP